MAMPRLTLVDVVWLFRTHQSNSRQTHPVSFFEPRAQTNRGLARTRCPPHCRARKPKTEVRRDER